MLLIIKGTPDEARKALTAHGMDAEYIHRLPVCGTESAAFVRGADLTAVMAWFTAPIAAKPGEGFPVGSLLYYHNESEG